MNVFAQAMRADRRTRRLIHLIEVGDVQGTPAYEFKVGDRFMLNYGATYTITGRGVSPTGADVYWTFTSDHGTDAGTVYHQRRRSKTLVAKVPA